MLEVLKHFKSKFCQHAEHKKIKLNLKFINIVSPYLVNKNTKKRLSEQNLEYFTLVRNIAKNAVQNKKVIHALLVDYIGLLHLQNFSEEEKKKYLEHFAFHFLALYVERWVIAEILGFIDKEIN